MINIVDRADTPVIRSEVRGAALWIIIDRAERRNALNPAVIAGLHEALATVPGRRDVRAVVITGAGDKAFCAGADLTQGSGVFADSNAAPTTDFGRMARVARELPVPLIARVNGACVAGGMGVMALCDLAIAAEHARFGLPEAKVGVFPMQVLVYLRRMIHPRYVNELCLTADLIEAAKAAQWGLVNEVAPLADLDARVEALVARIAACSPAALQRGRRVIAEMEALDFHPALSYAEAQIALASNTRDAREGLAAFNEKRRPDWLA